MANTLFDIAKINPVMLYSETIQYPERFRSRFMDYFSFQNQIRDYEDPAYYAQKWMKEDVIQLQFLTDYTDVKLQVVGEYDNVYKTVIPEVVTSAIDPAPNAFMNASITLTDLPEGCYYLRAILTAGVAVKTYISEPFEVHDLVENSVLFHYYNDTNDFGVAFDTDIIYQLRVEGGLTNDGFKPVIKSKIYEDQNLNKVRLSATPSESYKLVIGGAEGVPNWVANKINRLFACSYVSVDGGQFVRLEGDMERKGEENYPMAGWSLTLAEADNSLSMTFSNTLLFGVLDADGSLIIDYDNQPVLYK